MFKKFDVLHYNEMTSEKENYSDFNEQQLKVINDFLFNKIVSPKLTLGYFEENILKTI